MYIVIGGAWPYANGSLHIGHLAGLLPGDVLARYHRLKGDNVAYVSGSDCHGTPILLRAHQENKTCEEISGKYHQEFMDCFTKLGFSYDYYGETSSSEHKDFVTGFHRNLYRSESVIEEESLQAYCDTCRTFLPDRYVTGECPNCGKEAKGDQCEYCGQVIESAELVKARCAVCGSLISLRDSKHLAIKLSCWQQEILQNINKKRWRKNAVDFTLRYIDEGLKNRALTRDIQLGIDVPMKGYEDKKIYIWAENVLGYLSSCICACEKKGEDFADYYFNDTSFHYYIHGKDNIPFHSIILPALLLGEGSGYHLPDAIISSEYMTLEGKKISTSRNHAVWVKDLIEEYNPDTIRYFFLANGPQRRDADFTFREFVYANNGELLGVYGNFINRTLKFIEKYYDCRVPDGQSDLSLKEAAEYCFSETGENIEKANFKEALLSIFDLIRQGNKYFDTNKPWETRTTDPNCCRNTIYNCVQLIAAFAVLLEPFLPFSSAKVFSWLDIKPVWSPPKIVCGFTVSPTQILFERL